MQKEVLWRGYNCACGEAKAAAVAVLRSEGDLVRTCEVVAQSVPLLPERASLGESNSASCRLAKNCLAVTTHHHSLRVAKHNYYVEAALAFHIYEERIGKLNGDA